LEPTTTRAQMYGHSPALFSKWLQVTFCSSPERD